jgi:hypothetical protein
LQLAGGEDCQQLPTGIRRRQHLPQLAPIQYWQRTLRLPTQGFGLLTVKLQCTQIDDRIARVHELRGRARVTPLSEVRLARQQ